MKQENMFVQKITEKMKNEKGHLIAFWCIMAVILFARFYQLNSVPGDINQDEALAGYNAFTLATAGKDSFGNPLPMFLVAWGSGMNALESYLSIPFIALFGAHAWVIRFVPGVLGVLTLVAVYSIFRKTTNDIFALFVLFFTGIMPWHIMLSRCAIETNLAPAFLTFALYFFIRSLEKEKYLLLSAVCYGLSLYAYMTLWHFLPFLLLFEGIYFVSKKKWNVNRYTIGSLVILVLFFLPVILFLLVNHGMLPEIKLPFLTIPKLVYYKEEDISIFKFSEHIKNLWNIFWTQDDGFPWNTTKSYGIFYKISLPFTVIGFISMIVTGIRKRKEKSFSVEFLWLLQLIPGILAGLLMSGNVNRLNMLFLPVIVMTAYGVYMTFTGISSFERFKVWNYYLLVIPFLVYSAFFSHFETYYFTEYSEMMHGYFCYGIEEVLSYAYEHLDEDTNIYVTPNVSYVRVLFYGKENVNDYLETADYTNYPSPFLDVSMFGRYSFDIDRDNAPDGYSAYVLDSSYNDSVLVQTMERYGYQNFSAGNYSVWYIA